MFPMSTFFHPRNSNHGSDRNTEYVRHVMKVGLEASYSASGRLLALRPKPACGTLPVMKGQAMGCRTRSAAKGLPVECSTHLRRTARQKKTGNGHAFQGNSHARGQAWPATRMKTTSLPETVIAKMTGRARHGCLWSWRDTPKKKTVAKTDDRACSPGNQPQAH